MSASSEVLIRDLREQGIRLSRKGDKLHVVAPPGKLTPELKEALLARKPELLALLSSTSASTLRPMVNFRLPCTKPNSWATAIGVPGESIESLVADLRWRWPDVEVKP